jgi:hypothetical protein
MEKDSDRVNQSIADKRDPDDLRGDLLRKFTKKDDSHYEANDRRGEYDREWCTTRWGHLKDHIDMYMTREEFIKQAYVVQHQGRAYDEDSQSAMNRRTPSPERRATAEDPPPAPNEDYDEVTLGAYGDEALETRSGVVAPSPYYITIDGGDSYCQQSSDIYEAARASPEWYGF